MEATYNNPADALGAPSVKTMKLTGLHFPFAELAPFFLARSKSERYACNSSSSFAPVGVIPLGCTVSNKALTAASF